MCLSSSSLQKTIIYSRDQPSQPREKVKTDAHYTEADEDANSVLTIHAIENVSPIMQDVEIDGVIVKMK